MTLSADEFICCFLLHVLSRGFHRIRYYGLLGNHHRAERLAHCRQLLAMPPPERVKNQPKPDYRNRYEARTGISPKQCPVCGQGQMITIQTIDADARRPTILDTS